MDRSHRVIHQLNRRRWRGWIGCSCGRAVVWACALAAAAVVARLHAQSRLLGKIKDFVIPEFYDSSTASQQGTNQIKALLKGAVAQPRPDGAVEVESMWLGTFDRMGATNLVATAPAAMFQSRDKVVYSGEPLDIQTGNGQLSIKGVGFHCRLTNVVLIISNQVETTIHRDLVKSSGAASSRLASSVAQDPASAGSPAPALPPVLVLADRFVYDQSSNIVVYSDHVSVVDPLWTLTCRQLTLHLTTNGNLRQIVASHDVVFSGTNGHSRAMGDEAVYYLAESEEWLELLGAPARWRDDRREGYGPRFVVRPKENRVTASDPSFVRLPRRDLMQPSLGDPAGTTAGSSTGEETNQFVEITASFMEFQLLGTNQSARTIAASNQVVIVSPADASRATGERASYSDASGVLELTGQAEWLSEERAIRGDAFFFDRSNSVFRVIGNSCVRMPLQSLGTGGMVNHLFGDANNLTTVTNRTLEILSDQLEYRVDRLEFQSQVRGSVRQDQIVLGRLDCALLGLDLVSNRVQRIEAFDQVRLVQLPTAGADGRLVEKQLESELFVVDVDPQGHIRQMVAETNVLVRQMEYREETSQPLQTDLRAEIVTAWFIGPTNALDRIVAERNVIIDQPGGRALGDQAVYSREEDTLVLNGNVLVESPGGLLRAPMFLLRHFGLWPNRMNQLGVPLGRTRERSPESPGSASPTP